jgi:hypothetical protein
LAEKLYYPVFQLPRRIRIAQDCRSRSREEAKEYFQVLTAYFPWRVLLLLSWHGEQMTPDPEDDLLRLGAKVAEYINDPEFIYYEDVEVDWEGEKLSLGKHTGLVDTAASMAIDMGFFLAILLLQLDHPEIKWGLRLGGKKMANYHDCVVFGPNLLEYNPLQQSRGWGSSIVKGTSLPSIWYEYYRRWTDHVAGREPRPIKKFIPLNPPIQPKQQPSEAGDVTEKH